MEKYIKSARLRTLPLSVSGIIVGSALANHQFYETYIFWLAIFTAISFQILSNYANDYGDGVKGTDNNRQGEKRLVASGDISPNQMKKVIIITSIISVLISLILIYVAFGKDNFLYSLVFFVMSVISIISAIKYTVGKSAYGYSGFGDIFVFVFFGLVAVVGSYFLFTKQVDFSVFLPAFSVGLLSTSVLNLNNMRDRINDKKANKNTLVVKIGMKSAKKYHYFLIIFSLLFAVLYSVFHYENIKQFIFVIAYIPLIKHLIFVKKNKEEVLFDGELKKVGLSTFLFSILFGVGQIL
ncbi:MAG: 1,4-dihydroxy-2-naphthoate octaprenyltransferase [Tenacibaculum sp.]|nr:1,4-dihydroxy-2-naphthoate octaprenyltransferase [Tenacibaculum sp.]